MLGKGWFPLAPAFGAIRTRGSGAEQQWVLGCAGAHVGHQGVLPQGGTPPPPVRTPQPCCHPVPQTLLSWEQRVFMQLNPTLIFICP